MEAISDLTDAALINTLRTWQDAATGQHLVGAVIRKKRVSESSSEGPRTFNHALHILDQKTLEPLHSKGAHYYFSMQANGGQLTLYHDWCVTQVVASPPQ